MSNIERIKDILDKNNGIIKAEDLKKENIGRHYLKILQERGEIIKLDRGIYAKPDVWEDEMYILQTKYKKSIFSHGTALYLHDLTDRTPIYYTMTIPNSYNPKSIKQENVRLSYAVDNLLEVGVIQMKTSFGNYVRCYDKEKTICDMIRNKKNEDIQLFTDALKMYANRQDKDILLLIEYSKVLKIEKSERIHGGIAMKNAVQLNEKLKNLRKELKLSQEYVASVLGMNRTTVTTIESGTRKVTSEELKAFCELYGVTLDELMYDKDINSETKMFARTFSDLSDLNKSEIMNLIAFKKKIREQGVRNVQG